MLFVPRRAPSTARSCGRAPPRLYGAPGYPTGGGGSHVPDKKTHDFKFGKLVCGARVDNSRGVDSDDPGNQKWQMWFSKMPLYSKKVQQRPSCTVSVGNAMEQLVGVAYAAATNSRFLKYGWLDWTRNGEIRSSQQEWAELWFELQKIGLGPVVTGTAMQQAGGAGSLGGADASSPQTFWSYSGDMFQY